MNTLLRCAWMLAAAATLSASLAMTGCNDTAKDAVRPESINMSSDKALKAIPLQSSQYSAEITPRKDDVLGFKMQITGHDGKIVYTAQNTCGIPVNATDSIGIISEIAKESPELAQTFIGALEQAEAWCKSFYTPEDYYSRQIAFAP